jgi:uncharacterized membrane protein
MEPQGTPTPILAVGDAISYGWSSFKAQPGPLIGVFVVAWLVNVVVGVASSLIQDPAVLYYALQVVGLLVGTLLFMGITRVVLKVTRGERPEVGDLFITEHYGAFLLASLLFYVMFAVGLVFLIVPGIAVAVIFGFYGFAVIDRGDGITEALNCSVEITKGHRWTILVLGLAAFGINLLGALLCGVGLLVTYPVTMIAWAYAYKTLSGEPVAPAPA